MKRTAPTIDINLLGSVGVHVAGKTLRFPYKKPQLLLAYLITEAREVPRSDLSALLWPDRSEHNSRQNLRQALASLKSQLGESFNELFASSRKKIEFIGYEHCTIDIERMKSAIQCATSNHIPFPEAGGLLLHDIYRGPFCHGFNVPCSDQFNAWLESRQQEFHSMAVTLGVKLLNNYLHAEQEHHIIQSYNQLLAIDWHDESLINEFMKYLIAQGLQLQAITLFREHETRLRQEYGLRPDSHLVSLYESLTFS